MLNLNIRHTANEKADSRVALPKTYEETMETERNAQIISPLIYISSASGPRPVIESNPFCLKTVDDLNDFRKLHELTTKWA